MTPNPIPALTFDGLVQRVVRDLSNLIHSGATTERRLASMVGLSQSHLHNVLNGTRKLTPAIADQVLERLDWSLLNLVETTEALALIGRRKANVELGRDIPLATHAQVGPALPLPGISLNPFSTDDDPGAVEVAVPTRWLERALHPVAIAAGDDPEMEGIVHSGDILLVDCSARVRRELHEDALYVVRWNDYCLARWLRYSSRGLYLVSAQNWMEPAKWTLAVKPSSRRTEIVEGKIIALAQPPDGTFQRPALPFASS